MQIGIIGPGQVFGEEDVLNNRKYSTTVKCLSHEATCFQIKAEEFNYRMSKDKETWAYLKKKIG